MDFWLQKLAVCASLRVSPRRIAPRHPHHTASGRCRGTRRTHAKERFVLDGSDGDRVPAGRRHRARRRRSIVGVPRPAFSRGAEGAARGSPRTGQRRIQPGHVGHRRQPRRRRLRGRVHRQQPRRSVARQPGDLRAEGQYRERLQPAGARALHRRSLYRRRSRAAACSACRRAIPWTPASPTAATRRTTVRATIRWSADGSAASTSSAAGSRSTTRNGKIVGGLGVSGDSSCADHNIAWRTRHNLNLDFVPGGVGPDASRPDNIVYDITPQAGQMPGVSASGWGHPACSAAATTIAAGLPPVR